MKPKIITPHSRKEWARRITHVYGKTVSALINVGQQLIEAKRDLPHGDFGRMIRRDLPFKERTAQRFMQIAAHPVLSNPSFLTHLPPAYSILVVLAGWEPEELEGAIERGAIHPDVELCEIKLLRDIREYQIPAIYKDVRQQKKQKTTPPQLTVLESPAKPKVDEVPEGNYFPVSKHPEDIVEAEFVELEPPARHKDSPGLAALKSAWMNATETDRKELDRWKDRGMLA